MDLLRLFVAADEVTLAAHHEALGADRAAYAATLLLLLEQRVELTAGVRARTLAAAWARRDHELAEALLGRPAYNVACVAKAAALLDAGRRARSLRARIERLEKGGASARTLGALRSQLHDLEREGTAGSLSGALARHIRRWMERLPEPELASQALLPSHDAWRSLADVTHPRPASLRPGWFLPVTFGEPAPAGSSHDAVLRADEASLPAVASAHRTPYVYLRTRATAPSPALREAVARYDSLDTLLWYYEELRCPAADAHLAERLDAGEEPTLGCGKLLERAMTLRSLGSPVWERLLPVVDRQLARVRLPLAPPVLVLGDASSSMEAAIRVATIFGALLTVVTRAELRFFNGALLPAPRAPACARNVLAVTDATKANGSTAPAAALRPTLDARALVRSIVVVTDEEENTRCNGEFFDATLARYRAECFPAQVTFLSFIGQTARGAMTSALALKGVPYRQVRLDRARPDLTRLDSVLGELALDGPLFAERVDALATWLRSPGARVEEAGPVIRRQLGDAA